MIDTIERLFALAGISGSGPVAGMLFVALCVMVFAYWRKTTELEKLNADLHAARLEDLKELINNQNDIAQEQIQALQRLSDRIHTREARQ